MGDLVDITTVPKQKNIFYKITSGSLRFQVKGPHGAVINLVSTPAATSHETVAFILGHDDYTMAIQGEDRKSVLTPSILSGHEFREFWLHWHNGTICLGRGYEVDPIIIFEDSTVDIKYIAFAVEGHDACALQWRFELPPIQKQIKLKPVSNGTIHWLAADAQLPDGALIGGFEKEILYIIRAKHHGSLTPGKFVPSHGVGYIPWGGRMHDKSEFDVLCGYDCVWIPCSIGGVPAGAIEAGYSEGSNREKLYVGRARYHDHLIPGKVQPSHHVCYIPYKEREIAVNHYEILVDPNKNVQCANPFFAYDHIVKLV